MEEIEEQQEMVSYPYPHVTVSYDVLGHLEENIGSLKMMIIGSSWVQQFMILQYLEVLFLGPPFAHMLKKKSMSLSFHSYKKNKLV